MCYVKGILSLLLYAINLIGMALIILLVAPLGYLLPFASWRRMVHAHFLQRTPAWFAFLNYLIMQISTRGKWDVDGVQGLKQDVWYVMISNHQSWLDILVLSNVFHQKIPPLKFFMKKELLWQLPLAGLACYVLGYPFMSRHSHAEIRKNPKLKGKDAETTRNACRKLRDYPTTLINFLEGTRFTEAKKQRQQSPYQHLLKPRAGGVAVALQELHDILGGVISVVIHYPGKKPSLWDFASGQFEKVIVRYELRPLTADLLGDYHTDRVFRTYLQEWLNTIWKQNDITIESFQYETRD